jgi:hypothetical protein
VFFSFSRKDVGPLIAPINNVLLDSPVPIFGFSHLFFKLCKLKEDHIIFILWASLAKCSETWLLKGLLGRVEIRVPIIFC